MVIDLRNAPQDCGCVTHSGPHWIHEDRLTFEHNLRILERGGMLAPLAFAQDEAVRLQNKRYAMLKYTKDEQEVFLFPEGCGEDDYTRRTKEAAARLKERWAT